MTDKNGVVQEVITPLSLSLAEGPQTNVRCEVGMTINLGNYQSAKINVSLEAPSNLDTDSLDKTFEFLKNWCDAKLVGMRKEILEDVG